MYVTHRIYLGVNENPYRDTGLGTHIVNISTIKFGYFNRCRHVQKD